MMRSKIAFKPSSMQYLKLFTCMPGQCNRIGTAADRRRLSSRRQLLPQINEFGRPAVRYVGN